MNVINDPVTPTPVTPTNVLIVGVGGQGVIMVSKVLARLCQVKGFQVKQSEVHGMAKRGGGVFSHVRFGKQVWSPTIPAGEADILVALEWAEGLRWLNHLKRDRGTFIADTQQIVPPIACRNRKPGAPKAYSPETPAEIIEMVGNGFALDATRMAADLGNARAANTILLGALSTALALGCVAASALGQVQLGIPGVRFYSNAKEAEQKQQMSFELSDFDHKLLRFGKLFYDRFMRIEVSMPLEKALDLAWQTLAECFEPQELLMKQELIDRYYPSSQAGDDSTGQQTAAAG